jgi:sugar O-acyltransferase (sialic acid O-acetyltransferase NeuD family)
MPELLVIVGAGGFGREVVELVRAVNASAAEPVWDLLGVVDDQPSEENLTRLERAVVTYLGTTDWFVDAGRDVRFVVAIGSPQVRETVATKIESQGRCAAVLVHPDATVGGGVELGAGTIVGAGARLTANISVGRHVHIDTNVTVGHDTTLGDYVRLNPGSSISGDCAVGPGVLVGVGAVVLNQRIVGKGALIGGGACVVHDVRTCAVVKGVPAK